MLEGCTRTANEQATDRAGSLKNISEHTLPTMVESEVSEEMGTSLPQKTRTETEQNLEKREDSDLNVKWVYDMMGVDIQDTDHSWNTGLLIEACTSTGNEQATD